MKTHISALIMGGDFKKARQDLQASGLPEALASPPPSALVSAWTRLLSQSVT